MVQTKKKISLVSPKGGAKTNFLIQYKAIKKTRELNNPAPVDTFGCYKLYDKILDNHGNDKKINKEYEKIKRYQILIGLMLSSQTKDEITAKAMENIKNYISNNKKNNQSNTYNGMCAYTVNNIDENILKELIHPVGFYNKKAKYIKCTTKILLENPYFGDIPDNIKDLVNLPGVGAKMAYLCLNNAWKIPQGIGVDVHVNRIANRLEWVSPENTNKSKKNIKKITTSEEARIQLEEIVPQNLWIELNPLLVGFGQTVCSAVKPKCYMCILAYKNLCLNADKSKLNTKDAKALNIEW